MENINDPLYIYYFSGTGNARNVAHWFANTAIEKGCKATVIDIAKTNRLDIEPPESTALVGFISPTHGFNLPPIMLNFLARFPKSRQNKAFLINTRAGIKLGKWFLPGLSGIALYYAFFVLRIKGYGIIGMRSIDLPSNWLSIHPGLRTKAVALMHKKYKVSTRNFAEKILFGRKDFRALFDIIQDIAISPIAIGYYLVGRFFLAKTFIANKNCTNCGLCIKSCPVNAIKKIDNKPFWTYKCESCMKCMSICPERAIQTCHGFVAVIVYLSYSVLIAFLYRKYSLDQWEILKNGFIRFTFESAIILPVLYLGYLILHFLMRFKLIERVISFTSLTWYKFWNRYRALKP